MPTGVVAAPQVLNFTATRTIPVYGGPAGWVVNSLPTLPASQTQAAGLVRLPDSTGNWTTAGLPGVTWLPTGAAFTGAAGSAPMNSPLGGSPSTNANGAFRVGGPINGASPNSGNPTYAFQGDLYQVLLYSEVHTAAQQATITQWLRSYTFDTTCGYGLPSTLNMSSKDQSGVAYPAGYCGGQYGGILNGNCYQDCAAGNGIFTGANWGHTCSNGEWTGAPLVCRMQCPNAQPPLYASPTVCFRNIVADSLDSNVTTGLTYVATPTMPHKQLLSTWKWVAPGMGVAATGSGVNATGGSQGGYVEATPWYNDTCASMNAGAFSIYGFSTDRWTDQYSSYVPWGTGGNVTVSVQLAGAGAVGGLAVRVTSATAFYRVVLTAGGGGVNLYRVVGGVATPVPGGTALPNVTVYSAPVWHTLSVSYLNFAFNVSLDGVPVMWTTGLTTVKDTVMTLSTPGAPGMYAAAPWPSLVRFDNLVINGACDAFAQGVSILEGMNVTHSCLVGYTPLGNATRSCRTTPALASAPSYDGWGNAVTAATLAQFPGSYDSPGLTCRPLPVSSSYFLYDRPQAGALVGVVSATATETLASQLLTYSIVSITATWLVPPGGPQPLDPYPFGYGNTAGLFSIVACSGVIRVNSSTAFSRVLDSVYLQNITVLVCAIPDGQTLAAAFANVTVYMIPVLIAPQAVLPSGYDLTVNAGYVGPITGTLAVYNHNALPLLWSIIGGDSSYFSINALTGIISTVAPGISYSVAALSSAPPPSNVTVVIIVQVVDSADPTNFYSSLTVPIIVNEVHQLPFQQDYVNPPFTLYGSNAIAGQPVGVLFNTNPATNPDWWPVSMDIVSVSWVNSVASYTSPVLLSSNLSNPSPFAPLSGTFQGAATPGGPWTTTLAFSTPPPLASVPFMWPPPSLLQPSSYTDAVFMLNVSTTDWSGWVYYSRVWVVVLYDNAGANTTNPTALALAPNAPVSTTGTYPTAGGVVMRLVINYLLGTTVDLNVTVGSSGYGAWPDVMGVVECPLSESTGVIIPRTPGSGAGYVNTAYMEAANVLPTLLTQATIYCLLPPGQGAQPLTVYYATPNPVRAAVAAASHAGSAPCVLCARVRSPAPPLLAGVGRHLHVPAGLGHALLRRPRRADRVCVGAHARQRAGVGAGYTHRLHHQRPLRATVPLRRDGRRRRLRALRARRWQQLWALPRAHAHERERDRYHRDQHVHVVRRPHLCCWRGALAHVYRVPRARRHGLGVDPRGVRGPGVLHTPRGVSVHRRH